MAKASSGAKADTGAKAEWGVKAEWGAKHSCPRCSTRFYDLGKDDPVTCINCGYAWHPEPILKSKQPLPFHEEKISKDEDVDGDDTELDDDIEDDDADDSVADVSLDDDDADLSDVVDTKREDEE